MALTPEQQAAIDRARRAKALNPEQLAAIQKVRGNALPVAQPPSPLAKGAQEAPIGIKGVGEAALTMATGAIAEPLSGLAGIGAAIIPGGRSGGDMVNAARDTMTYQPRSAEGKQALQNTAEFLEPVSNVIGKIEKASGDAGYAMGGPVGGAIGVAVPTAIGMAMGRAGTKGIERVIKSQIPAESASLLKTGQEAGVRIMTSDASPPDTFIGKFAQGHSEKMGPLGSGPARAEQQVARQAVLSGLADEFDIELDSDFAARMVNSINEKSAATLKRAGEQRMKAVTALDTYGEVPLNKTSSAIAAQIARQERLGEKADKSLLDNLARIQSAVKGGEFSLVKDIRTEVIDDLKALNRSEDPRAAASLQQVKSAMDEDMIEFARSNDREAAANWIQSNRAFATELQATRETELKRILRAGDATPEAVMPLLRGGKRSELVRLKNALGPTGITHARAAILQDALKESGFFAGNINPDRFVNAMQKASRLQARDVFFTKLDDAKVDGLVKLLDATRRAQQAAAAPATGVQTIPILGGGAAGAALMAEPITAIATMGSMSAFAKAYESAPVRNLLLKIAQAKKGSPEENQYIQLAVPLLIGAMRDASPEQEPPQ